MELDAATAEAAHRWHHLQGSAQPGVQAVFPAGGDSLTTFFCLAAGGGTYCWGDNGTRQLGSIGEETSAIFFAQLSDSQHIATGPYHGCAIVNGQVRCWGRNDHLEAGPPSGTSCPFPNDSSPCNPDPTGITLPQIGSATDVTVGTEHSCAIAGGAVYCWGANDGGALARSDPDPQCGALPCGFEPQQVSGIPGVAEQVRAGDDFTCVLASGRVHCWGRNDSGQTGRSFASTMPVLPAAVRTDTGLTLESVEEIDVGERHACARTSDGSIWCWGNNDRGQVGIGFGQMAVVPFAVRVSFKPE